MLSIQRILDFSSNQRLVSIKGLLPIALDLDHPQHKKLRNHGRRRFNPLRIQRNCEYLFVFPSQSGSGINLSLSRLQKMNTLCLTFGQRGVGLAE